MRKKKDCKQMNLHNVTRLEKSAGRSEGARNDVFVTIIFGSNQIFRTVINQTPEFLKSQNIC